MTASLIVLTLVVAAPKLKDMPPPAPDIVGRWSATKITIGGKDSTPGNQDLEYEFTTDGKWLIYRQGKVLDDKPRTYTLEPKVGPTAIEVNEGKPQPSIFKIEKDTLTLTMQINNGGRPTDFDTQRDGIMSLTMKRVNK